MWYGSEKLKTDGDGVIEYCWWRDSVDMKNE